MSVAYIMVIGIHEHGQSRHLSWPSFWRAFSHNVNNPRKLNLLLFLTCEATICWFSLLSLLLCVRGRNRGDGKVPLPDTSGLPRGIWLVRECCIRWTCGLMWCKVFLNWITPVIQYEFPYCRVPLTSEIRGTQIFSVHWEVKWKLSCVQLNLWVGVWLAC